MLKDKFLLIAVATGMCVGLVGAGIVVASTMANLRDNGRYVSVKGVSEKDVKADLAIWPIKARVAGDDLTVVSAAADVARKKVLSFLADNGIGPDQVASQDLRVQDRQANDFAATKGSLRYVVEFTLLLRSKEVDKIARVSQMTDQLVKAGVVLAAQGNWERTGPQYVYTQLNSIKPAMMAEATRSAREVAAQFAGDSGSKVGPIRKASQGLFSISDRDRTTPDLNGAEGVIAQASDINKKVRVVVNVDYLLEK